MPYMAVGSRQMLYTDSIAPALAGDQAREVATYEDNRPEDSVGEPARVPSEAQTSRTAPEVLPGEPGSRVDVSA